RMSKRDCKGKPQSRGLKLKCFRSPACQGCLLHPPPLVDLARDLTISGFFLPFFMMGVFPVRIRAKHEGKTQKFPWSEAGRARKMRVCSGNGIKCLLGGRTKLPPCFLLRLLQPW